MSRSGLGAVACLAGVLITYTTPGCDSTPPSGGGGASSGDAGGSSGDMQIAIDPNGGSFGGSVDVILSGDCGGNGNIWYRLYDDSGFIGGFRYSSSLHIPRSLRIEVECEEAGAPVAEASFTIQPRYTEELHRTSEPFSGWLNHRLSMDGQGRAIASKMPGIGFSAGSSPPGRL